MNLGVIDGAQLQCSQGSSPCSLIVTNNKNVQIDDQPYATVLDHKPAVNIGTFGTCKITKGPCAPVTSAPWTPGSAKKVQIGDQLVLLPADTLICAVPGIITITSPLQARNVYDE